MISLGITSKLPVSLKNFENVIITILGEFVCDAKSFAIAVLVFFLLLFFPLAFFGETAKSSVNELLPRKRETKIGSISLATRNKVCVTNVFEDVICDACDPCNVMCFTLLMVTSIHNIGKYTKIRKSKKRWMVTQKIQGSKKREIDLISRSLKKNEKDVQKKKLIDTEGESNIATVSEELVSSENIAR